MSRASLRVLGLIAFVVAGPSCGGPGSQESRVAAPPPGLAAPSVQEVQLPQPGLARQRPASAPFSLTSSDGVGLEIASVSVTSVIEDPVAVTELKLSFENPEDRTIEGRFTFSIPPGASLSRFAMRIGGAWMEGEVVEKQRARMTYEEFLHQKRDPALLEQGAGNELAVRVFPILPHEKKELLVTYSELLTERNPYRLRLAGLATVARLDAQVFASGKLLVEQHQTDTLPAADLLVPAGRWSTGREIGLRAGTQAIARVRIPEAAREVAPFESLVVLLDTSASRALDLSRVVTALGGLLSALPPESKVSVACFDQEIAPVFEGRAQDFGTAERELIENRGALGASDLSGALIWARDKGRSLSRPRLVLLSDGVVTAGLKGPSDLRRLASSLTESGFVRADAIALGGIRDESVLANITKGALPHGGVVIGEEAGSSEISRRLLTRTLPTLPISVDGASWLHPTTLEGAQPGDEIVVAFESKEKAPQIHLGSSAVRPLLRETAAPVVARSLALARIESIEANTIIGEAEKRALIVPISTRHRIVSQHTAMLVLETEADYDRFSIDRKANLDVLTIDGGRIAMRSVARGKPIEKAPSALAANAPGNQWGADIEPADGPAGLDLSGAGTGAGGAAGGGVGLGAAGTIGHGAGVGTGQGFGSGSGSLGVTHRARPPMMRMGATVVSGRLPPEVIQRIVRQNFGRFRGCYQTHAGPSSTLSGRVVVRFVIARDGTAQNAQNAGSTIASPALIRCVVAAFGKLSFPQPEEGLVTVTYPIAFGAAAAEEPASSGAIPAPRARLAQLAQHQGDAMPPADNQYAGNFGVVMRHVENRDTLSALREAIRWRAESPGEVLAYVALGEAAELAQNKRLAARAYGSILELWSYRVDMQRLAGERLERVGDSKSLTLAAEAYETAVADRPDHPSGHRLRAMALLKLGRSAEAFEALSTALSRDYADGRFRGSETILRDDLATIGAAWVAADPSKSELVSARLRRFERSLPTSESLRFVLVWETDASDVDLHVGDVNGGHAYYGSRVLASGGKLEADVTNGYGPEGFSIDQPPTAYPYRLRVHYYSRGPMGFGMGKVQIIRHDGHGRVSFDERPFVLMQDRAVIDLGEVLPVNSSHSSG